MQRDRSERDLAWAGRRAPLHDRRFDRAAHGLEAPRDNRAFFDLDVEVADDRDGLDAGALREPVHVVIETGFDGRDLALDVPGPAVELRRRDEMAQARGEHHDRGEAGDTGRSTGERRTHRHGVLAVP